jgi:hypothetical protein
LIVHDHGVIYSGNTPPTLLPNETIDKSPIHIEVSDDYGLHPLSRINYGKVYAVEHNVKVREIGMVDEAHLDLLSGYFESAMVGSASFGGTTLFK